MGLQTKITNLKDTPLSEITRCFNEAFSDYFVQFSVNEHYLKQRWITGRVRYDLSFGYFVDGILRGFIINGIDQRDGVLNAHNCATGIEPAYRGQGILGEIYAIAIDQLKKEGVSFSTLEVISINKKAIRAYEKAGFRLRAPLLHCYKGIGKLKKEAPDNVSIQQVLNPDFPFYTSCFDTNPSWEMSEAAILATNADFEFWEIQRQEKKLGYLIYSPNADLILQFGVHPSERRKGYAQMLFSRFCQAHNPIRVNNVPATSVNTVQFLEGLGLANNIDQYEMERRL